MTVSSLVVAVLVGLAAGVAGRLLTRRRPAVPVWLPVAAGIGAAVLATLVLQMADTDRIGPSGPELVLQLLCASAGVAVVQMTAHRQP